MFIKGARKVTEIQESNEHEISVGFCATKKAVQNRAYPLYVIREVKSDNPMDPISLEAQ